jgi:hypothetical protein
MMRRFARPQGRKYKEEVLRRIEDGTYRIALAVSTEHIRHLIRQINEIISDPRCEPDVKEWKEADLRALRRVLTERNEE